MATTTFPSLLLSNPSLLSLFFSTILLVTLIVPSLAVTCNPHDSQTYPGNKTYDNCINLPYLGATLHYTFNSTNSSLSIAFSASPPTSSPGGDAWVSWAINPTSSGMVGAQALVSLRSSSSHGKVVAKTFNISSYHSVVESPLAFDVWDLSTDQIIGDLGSTIRIYASVKVPEGSTSVNQVWQVGGSVDGTKVLPKIHDMTPDNMNARGKLVLVEDANTGTSSAASAVAPTPAPLTNEGSIVGKGNGVPFAVLGLVLLGPSSFGWF